MDDALSAALEGARRNPEGMRPMVDAVKAAIEAAPKPKRLTWGEVWRRQQSTWLRPGGEG